MATLLYINLANQIEKEIIENNIMDGAKLPSERKIAADHYVSRNVVRNALKLLEDREVVEIIPDKGAFVSTHNSERALAALKNKFMSSSTSFLDCIEVREVLEIAIAERAFDYIGDEEIERLEKHYDSMEKLKQQGKTGEFLEADCEFHKMIASFVPNKLFYLMLDTYYQISPLNFFSFNRLLEDSFTYSHHDHRLLIDAFILHDKKLIVQSVHNSMEHLRDKYLYLKEGKGGASVE